MTSTPSPNSTSSSIHPASETAEEDTIKIIDCYIREHRLEPLMTHLYHDVLFHLPEDPLEFLEARLGSKATNKMIIIGAPNCGKSTQCDMITKTQGLVRVDVNDLLMEEVKKYEEKTGVKGANPKTKGKSGKADDKKKKVGTNVDKLGNFNNVEDMRKSIYDCISTGSMVPATLAVFLIKNRLEQDDVKQHGWVLDGFPRTRSEARALQINGIIPNVVIVLDLDGKRIGLKRFGFGGYLNKKEDTDAGQGAKLHARAPETADATPSSYSDAEKTFKLAGCSYFPMIDGNVEGFSHCHDYCDRKPDLSVNMPGQYNDVNHALLNSKCLMHKRNIEEVIECYQGKDDAKSGRSGATANNNVVVRINADKEREEVFQEVEEQMKVNVISFE